MNLGTLQGRANALASLRRGIISSDASNAETVQAIEQWIETKFDSIFEIDQNLSAHDAESVVNIASRRNSRFIFQRYVFLPQPQSDD